MEIKETQATNSKKEVNLNDENLNKEETDLKVKIKFLNTKYENLKEKDKQNYLKEELNVNNILQNYKPLTNLYESYMEKKKKAVLLEEKFIIDEKNKKHLYILFKDMNKELLEFFMESIKKEENKKDEKKEENNSQKKNNEISSKEKNEDKTKDSNTKDNNQCNGKFIGPLNPNPINMPLSLSFKSKNTKVQKFEEIVIKTPEAQKLQDDGENYFLQQILLENKDKERLNYDKFSCNFFMTSFSKKKAECLENSEGTISECCHKHCSFLPSMIPEVIYSYPKNNDKGPEINRISASVNFPNGLKVCYGGKERDLVNNLTKTEQEKKDENLKNNEKDLIRTNRNFRFVMTDILNNRYSSVAYHFYLKMENKDFEKTYNVTPMKTKLKSIFNDFYFNWKNETNDNIKKDLNECEELIDKKFVYVPFSLCLVSKYPFIIQMEKCLESIRHAIENNIEEELNRLISYIVDSIPAPSMNSKILFPLPYHYEFLEIQPSYFKDIRDFGSDPLIIFQYLSFEELIYTLSLLIFDQKILVVGEDFDVISKIMMNIISLIYPFEYNHTFLPILSEKILKYSGSITPFFLEFI